MNTFPAEASAAFLASHFRGRTKGAPAFPGPSSRAEAYRVQDLMMETLEPACGWKVGRAASDPEPYCAPLPGSRLLDNVGSYLLHDSAALLEAELGLRLGCDVPASASNLSRADCAQLIDAIVPAIEILETRLTTPHAQDPLWKLADLQGNGGVVLGAPVPWTGQDLNKVNLAIRGDGDGQPAQVNHPFGEPLDLFCWLVDHVSRHRGGLKRGDVIITGSYCGIVTLRDEQRFTAAFPEYGAVCVDVVR